MPSATATPVEKEGSYSPPYVAFKTFKNFVDHLAEHGVPTKIDKSVMDHLSGGTQSHLSSALRFLALVAEDGSPDPTLVQMVEARSDEREWKEVLGALLKDAYSEVVSGIDIEKASARELDKCFEAKKCSGSMLDRSVRFYLCAMSDAGLKVSPHIGKRKPRAQSRGNGSKSKAKPSDSAEQEKKTRKPDQTPEGTIEYPIYFQDGRKGSICVPTDLTTADCKMIQLVIPMLEAYAESN